MSNQNYFTNIDAIGDFNDPTIDNSGFGSLSAAEKNQTYFAYFNGVGSTSPEILDQTAYFIKYLIDVQGNVVTPQANSIALLNLNQNFEVGKTANVTSLEGTTLFNTLLGNKTITGVGKIEPIFVTQTGSGIQDFVRTVEFTDVNNNYIYDDYDFAFNAQKPLSQTITDDLSVIQFTSASFNPNNNFATGSLSSFTSLSSSYAFPVDTSTYSNPVKLAVATWLYVSVTQTHPIVNAYIRIVTSSVDNPTAFDYVLCSKIYQYPTSQTLVESYSAYEGKNLSVTSSFTSFSSGSRVRAEIFVDDYDTFDNITYLGASNFKLIPQYSSPTNTVYPYWYPTPRTTDSFYLTASTTLGNAYNFSLQQILPTQSQGFSTIAIPFQPIPGDFIRFERNPLKTFVIYEVITDTPNHNLVLRLNKPIPAGTQIQNCVLYRILPNGNYVILDVKKPDDTTGQPLTGFLKPQYMSKELEDNFTTIIQKLAAEGTI
jgi:hypothetical protein